MICNSDADENEFLCNRPSCSSRENTPTVDSVSRNEEPYSDGQVRAEDVYKAIAWFRANETALLCKNNTGFSNKEYISIVRPLWILDCVTSYTLLPT